MATPRRHSVRFADFFSPQLGKRQIRQHFAQNAVFRIGGRAPCGRPQRP
ncbi:hypothetical protein HMPREF1868_01981 [Olsenella sp. DNF00959]|nr:hypothetical protein HMPREF1868_01981 [Olsenella sp. DNF00959]